MSMYSWLPIKKFLNNVPPNILKEIDSTTLTSWAFEFIREYFKKLAIETKIVVIPITNNKGKLPAGIIGFHDALYSQIEPKNGCEKTKTFDEEDEYYWVYNIVDEFDIYLNSAIPMSYKGRDPHLIVDSKISFYCKQCEIGFSVDKQMSCITVDRSDGYAIVVYSTYLQNDNKEFLIPEIPHLFNALAHYAQYKFWENKTVIKEEGSMQLANLNYQRAFWHKDRCKAGIMLRGLNPDKMYQLIYNRFNTQLVKHNMVTGNYKNRLL